MHRLGKGFQELEEKRAEAKIAHLIVQILLMEFYDLHLVSQGSRKTAQCCLEKNCVRATLQRTAVNSLPELSQANHEKLYESEKRTELIQTTHVGWANWMNYLFSVCEKGSDGSMTIPAAWVERWQRQIDTPYIQLSEQEKQSDRNQVADILPIIAQYIKTIVTAE